MAKDTKEPKDVWLNVLIGFIITVLLLSVAVGIAAMDKKVDKAVFEKHEKYQTEQYKEIKGSLQRIEDKL